MNTLPRLGPATKFTLLLTLPLAAFLLGAYKVLMALAVSSESIKYLPSNLVYAPDILIALAILIGSTVLSIGATRVMFSFSRYVEVRVGYTQLSSQLVAPNPQDSSVHTVPELPKPVVVGSLNQPSDDYSGERQRDANISERRHQTASAYARLASFRAAARRNRGVIEHQPVGDGVSLQSQDESLYPLDGRPELQ